MNIMNQNYGSCDNNENNSRSNAGAAEIEGEKPRLLTVAVSVAAFLVALVLFIAEIRHNPLPLGNAQLVAIPLLQLQGNVVPDPNAYPRRPFITKNGRNITLPVLGFPSVALAQYPNPDDQALANEAVRHAVEDLQISYFDVAPEYGDGVAQERLGPALRPYREHVFLAAKTMYRDAAGSARDLANTLHALKTDHLDLYQFHSISTTRDVDEILGEGEFAYQKGAMSTFQQAKKEGKIRAIGFSAHNEAMAVRMIESGLVETCMFPINFAAFYFGGIGKDVLRAATENNVGVIALKAGARGRLTPDNGDAVHVPNAYNHIPEWKRKEMIDYPVFTSETHHTWYEPEDDHVELRRLISWSLNQEGVTAVLPPGSLILLDDISDMLRGKEDVPKFDESDMQHMLERYNHVVPIFHNRSIAGTKVST